MNIQFDENGFVKPYDVIDIDIKIFQNTFVFNAHRAQLFEEYLEFLKILNTMPIGRFHQWVNGSFTTKKAYPKDIDFVCFVNSTFYRTFEKRLMGLAYDFKQYGLDAYFEPVFPETHFMSAATRYNIADWKQLYSRDRQFRKKGFIQLNF
jgi:hypothetical protein